VLIAASRCYLIQMLRSGIDLRERLFPLVTQTRRIAPVFSLPSMRSAD
jgi:hypothetical protein